MLFVVFVLVLLLTWLAYTRRHNLFLWLGVVMAWVWFFELCAGVACDLLLSTWQGLIGA